MVKTGILFPLGLGFLAFGGYEYAHQGMTQHAALLLFMGGLNMVYTLGKAVARVR